MAARAAEAARTPKLERRSEVEPVMRITAGNVRLKRAYEPPAGTDGVRILVDRLWPRGVRKTEAAIDEWAKDLAPSAALRKWFGHDPEKWNEFRRRYAEELSAHTDALERLRALAGKGVVTLVYAARDEAHNDAVVLRELLLHGKVSASEANPH